MAPWHEGCDSYPLVGRGKRRKGAGGEQTFGDWVSPNCSMGLWSLGPVLVASTQKRKLGAASCHKMVVQGGSIRAA